MAAGANLSTKPVEERLDDVPVSALMDNAPTYELPAPPKSISKRLQGYWEEFWVSPVAKLIDPVSDLEVVTRLFELYQIKDDLMEEIRVLPPGGKKNSALSTFTKVSSEARFVEDRVGMNPVSRLRLGVALFAAKKASLDFEAEDEDF